MFYYTSLLCHELKKSENVEVPEAEEAASGSISGLYVYDDFITEAEEAKLVEDIDSQPWIKLLNRRVQHYGYEFKYGTNDVDLSQK